MAKRIRVWDLPTRISHWALAFCVVSLVITGYQGKLEWHARFGYAVLALLLFRIVWGFAGGHWSRFASFVRGPGAVARYLRGQAHPDHLVGHNPLGAGSVLAMLVVLLAQATTGLFGDDDSGFTGPLNRYVSNARGLALTWYHKRVGQWLVIGLVVLHIAAIFFYLWRKRENLIRPMVSGDKVIAHEAPPSRDDMASRLAALLLFGVCSGLVWWVVSLGGSS